MHWFRSLSLLVAVGMSACAGPLQPVLQRPASAVATIPLAQPLNHTAGSQTTLVEFDNPERADGAHTRPVIIGMRFKIFVGESGHPDAARLLDRHIAESDALSRLPLGATVRLWRIDGTQPVPIRLQRTRYDRATRQTVREPATDGRVDAMFPNTTDRLEAERAGLWPTQPGWFVDEYSLAWSPRLAPGRYRAEVTFAEALRFPAGRIAELSVARDYPAY